VGPRARFTSGKGRSSSGQTDSEHVAGQVPSLPEGPGQHFPLFPLLPQAPVGSPTCLLLPQARGREKWSCPPTGHSELPEMGAGVQTQRVDLSRGSCKGLHTPRSPSPSPQDGRRGLGFALWKSAPFCESGPPALASLHERTSRHTTLSPLCSSSPAGLTLGSQAQGPG